MRKEGARLKSITQEWLRCDGEVQVRDRVAAAREVSTPEEERR